MIVKSFITLSCLVLVGRHLDGLLPVQPLDYLWRSCRQMVRALVEPVQLKEASMTTVRNVLGVTLVLRVIQFHCRV